MPPPSANPSRDFVLAAQPPSGAPDWRWQRVQQLRKGIRKGRPSACDDPDHLVRRALELLPLLERRGTDAKPPSLHLDLQWALAVHEAGSLTREALEAYILANVDPAEIAQEIGCPGGASWIQIYEALVFDVRTRLKSQVFIAQVLAAPNQTANGLMLRKLGAFAYATDAGVELVNAAISGVASREAQAQYHQFLRQAALRANLLVASAPDLAKDAAAMRRISDSLRLDVELRRAELAEDDLKGNSLGRTQQQMAEGLGLALRNIADVVFPDGVEPQAQERARMDIARGVEARRKLAEAEKAQAKAAA